MAHKRLVHETSRPEGLLDLAIKALFRLILNLLPTSTREIKLCKQCKFQSQNKNIDSNEETLCTCFRFYQLVLELYSYLPMELRQRILEDAQKKLDNAKDVQSLLGINTLTNKAVLEQYLTNCLVT